MFLHQSSIQYSELIYFTNNLPDRQLSVLLTIADLPAEVKAFTKTERHRINSLALDSGAFSVNSGRKGLSENSLYKKYTSYLKITGGAYDLIFNYDIDFQGTEDGFDRNLYYLLDMKKQDLDPIPVVHNLYNGEIEYYIKEGYKKLAIGQCKDGRRFNDIRSAVNRCHEAGILVHLFGISGFDFLVNLPVWSCDSSSWAQYSKFGQVMYWNPEKVGMDKTDRIYFPKFQTEPNPKMGHYYARYRDLKNFEEYIDSKLNITVSHLLGIDDQFYQKVVNILYFAELERIVTERHKQKGFVIN